MTWGDVFVVKEALQRFNQTNVLKTIFDNNPRVQARWGYKGFEKAYNAWHNNRQQLLKNGSVKQRELQVRGDKHGVNLIIACLYPLAPHTPLT